MIIDVHGHIISAEAAERAPMPRSLVDVEGMIEAKAAAGIELTIVGSPSGARTMAPADRFAGYRQPFGYQQPFDQLRALHDWLGETVQKWWRHLRAYVYCDVFGDEKSIAAAAATLREPGFVGLIANFSADAEYLDSPRADAFFAMAEEAGVPILLHAGPMPASCRDIANYGLLEIFGRPCDATLGLAALVLSGRLERHPSLKFISANSGGAFSLFADRIDWAVRPRHWDDRSTQDRGEDDAAGAPVPELHRTASSSRPSELAARLYVDTTFDHPSLHEANLRLLGPQHIVFGTDAPPIPVKFADKVQAVRDLPIGEAEVQDILAGNALRLFDLTDFLEARASAEERRVPAGG
ncbi:aminocarboxymuconate-semialdehyde decarboxylase [Amycolatopsis tolypomycina]|uniref:Aminocarboxymuconate-semialdehyde decarboxylase n=1 Tax=Amycolatopsis tolypomycina TaxID=208445 RepID=A0A1H4TYL9_9PSEU|nr:amidohydrolase family protein [Amycolatopsis tolypomycina]SEC61131.1 aminocarboxymuconate-semialdehyde decarboxylase [Amycolatopsis tolypomycina]